MKRGGRRGRVEYFSTFSILERIDVGETMICIVRLRTVLAFSILERIDVGETTPQLRARAPTQVPFSILERIDVGET